MTHRMHVALALVVLIASRASVGAQQVTRIPDAESCPRCEVRRELVTTLAVPDTLSTAEGPMQVFVDGRQRYWGLSSDRVPLVFGSNGSFLGKIGRAGAGPGEFVSAVSGFAVPGDSVVVIDQSNLRAQIVGPDLRPGRFVNFQWRPLYKAVVKHWPDSVIMTSVIRTPDGAGWPLHLLSFAGRDASVLKSFGPGSGDIRPGVQSFLRRQPPAAARSGGSWSIALDSYTIYRWSDAGPGHPDQPPPPHIVDIVEDSTGLLWIVARIPSERWRTAWKLGSRQAALTGYTAKDVDILKLWQTVIEVIDPAARVVVRRVYTDDFVVSVMPDGRASIYWEAAGGEPRYQIVRWKLVRQ